MNPSQRKIISCWTLRIGLLFVVIGLLLLSPAAEVLPVDFWGWINNLVLPASSQHTYMRVVQNESSRVFEFTLLGVGLLLLAAAMYSRPNK